jgi:hypothetical protein
LAERGMVTLTSAPSPSEPQKRSDQLARIPTQRSPSQASGVQETG